MAAGERIHMRTQIRRAIRDRLLGLPTTGDNAFTGTPWPLPAGQRPGWVVTAPTEVVTDGSFAEGDRHTRDASVTLTGYADGEAVEDTLDAMALEAERAIGRDPRLGMLAMWVQLARTEIAIDGESGKRLGEIRLILTVTYRTDAAAPDQGV